MKKIAIIGGGIGGLLSAIQLARKYEVTLIERKCYPQHRVCGEYVSNEVLPFLSSCNVLPETLELPQINQFMLSSSSGRAVTLPLDMGGFGISRSTFDALLYEKAKALGVSFILNTEVSEAKFLDGKFLVNTTSGDLDSDFVIGAFGKRSKLDIHLRRPFVEKRSPYVGVKYHLKTDHPKQLIALHNFEGGYCGMSHVENDTVNLCYLVHRDLLRKHGTIEQLQKEVLSKNPFLRSVFENADFLFKKPETINEISFETKSPVENHIFMVGDAAGMITPLCGNGMAMAVRSSKLLCDLLLENDLNRDSLERAYEVVWKKYFTRKLWFGRQVQKLSTPSLQTSQLMWLYM